MINNPLPAYLYQQYNNDPDLLAFFTAYNNISQDLLNQTNNLNLPIYTNLNAPLLDWVALSIYGVVRPSLSQIVTTGSANGVYDTQAYNVMGYSINSSTITNNFYIVTDDYFQRILTWNFYKGDGFQYNTRWLKRRIARFLYGVNGTDIPSVNDIYNVSVSYSDSNITIHIPNTSIAPIFQSALLTGALNVPFQYNYNVTY
jgi:hypothetical protein